MKQYGLESICRMRILFSLNHYWFNVELTSAPLFAVPCPMLNSNQSLILHRFCCTMSNAQLKSKPYFAQILLYHVQCSTQIKALFCKDFAVPCPMLNSNQSLILHRFCCTMSNAQLISKPYFAQIYVGFLEASLI